MLLAALERNLYRENDATDANLKTITSYTRGQSLHLDKVSINLIMAGELEFDPRLLANIKTKNEC